MYQIRRLKFCQIVVILFQDFKFYFRVYLLADKNILPPEFENFTTDATII